MLTQTQDIGLTSRKNRYGPASLYVGPNVGRHLIILHIGGGSDVCTTDLALYPRGGDLPERKQSVKKEYFNIYTTLIHTIQRFVIQCWSLELPKFTVIEAQICG